MYRMPILYTNTVLYSRTTFYLFVLYWLLLCVWPLNNNYTDHLQITFNLIMSKWMDGSGDACALHSSAVSNVAACCEAQRAWSWTRRQWKSDRSRSHWIILSWPILTYAFQLRCHCCRQSLMSLYRFHFLTELSLMGYKQYKALSVEELKGKQKTAKWSMPFDIWLITFCREMLLNHLSLLLQIKKKSVCPMTCYKKAAKLNEKWLFDIPYSLLQRYSRWS